MAASLAHRGPDDEGSWSDPEAGIAFGFRRLAILDLSSAGRQPMASPTGRYVTVFNGEIYNHGDLREELGRSGFSFRGRSDTEVIGAAFERWGVAEATRRFIGMFAIATWDREGGELSLFRDRLGIKPLYVYQKSGLVLFASEVQALLQVDEFDRTLDREAVTSYLRYLYVPAPRSIFRHVRKLPPGTIVTVPDPTGEIAPQPYWDLERVAEAGMKHPFEGNEEEALDVLEELLRDAVGTRLEADVPVGALLSGGIDSSTVVSLAQEISRDPVATFSIAFDSPEHDEAHHARAVAEHLGTRHTEIAVTGEEALALVPRIPEIFDEPLADPSQIPTFLVSKLARRSVTVGLSGDGGDEVFGGYNRYLHGDWMIRRSQAVPRLGRRALAAAIRSLPTTTWERTYSLLEPAIPAPARQRLAGEKLAKVGRLLGSGTAAGMYRSLHSAWHEPEQVVLGATEPATALLRILSGERPESLTDRMMLADQLQYLPDDLLVKVDRASMAVSLEVRVPLLDHRVVGFAWRLPHEFKFGDRTPKRLLRRLLYRRVPRELVDRPKVGFSVPLADWLEGPLRPWAEDLLAPEELRRDDLLRPEPIREAWEAFGAGYRERALAVWSVLVLQAWRRRWGV